MTNDNLKELSPAFKNIFKEIIQEFSNIIIDYEHFTKTYKYYDKDKECIDFNIISVNDCSTHDLFNEKLLNLYEESVLRLKEEINTFSVSEKISFLKETKKSLDFLKNLVINYDLREPENEYGTKEWLYFKSFSIAKLIGTYSERIEDNRKFILYKCRYFAEAWLDTINNTQAKIDYLINNFDLIPVKASLQNQETSNIKEKFKTTLSVDELAYFFRLLATEKIIDIPEGKVLSYYKFISDNFSSKKQEIISYKSIKNKYIAPDYKTADSIHGRLIKLLQTASYDKENL